MKKELDLGLVGWIIVVLIGAIAIYGVVCMFTAGVVVGIFVLLTALLLFIGLVNWLDHKALKGK